MVMLGMAPSSRKVTVLPDVASTYVTRQPFAQLLVVIGVTVTGVLRVMASLRAIVKDEKRSKLAVLTRWLRMNPANAGPPADISTPMITMTIISSGSVKPRLRRGVIVTRDTSWNRRRGSWP